MGVLLRLAACAVLLCLVVPSSSALRWLSDSSEPESNAAAAGDDDGYRTAYHFRPTKNWQNDPNDVEVVFEVPALDGAENLDPNQLLDPQRLCGEKGASVPGGVGPFGLLVLASSDLQEHTSVFFRVFRHNGKYKVLMCTDLRRSTKRADVYKPPYGGFVDIDIQKERSISLRTLIDHSVVESYGGGGRTVITARVYPEHAETSNNRLLMFNNGTGMVKVSKLDAWELKAADVNVPGDGLITIGSMHLPEAY